MAMGVGAEAASY